MPVRGISQSKALKWPDKARIDSKSVKCAEILVENTRLKIDR